MRRESSWNKILLLRIQIHLNAYNTGKRQFQEKNYH